MAQTWTDFEMVVNINVEGTYDTSHASRPTVIKDGTTYKMWYTGYDGTNYRIIYCDSANGTTWSNHQMVVNINVEGTYDTRHAGHPTVILDGTTYKMWYSGHDGTNWRIIYCDSANGTTWSNHSMVVNINVEGTYDTTHASQPIVILDGSTYKMWYGSHDGTNWRTIYCDSANGTTWDNHSMVVDLGDEGTYDTVHALAPTVILDGSTYKMWYGGHDGTDWRILYCDSADGTTWDNHSMVVDLGAEGTYDTVHATNPTVILDGSTYKMWYTGSDGTNDRILYTRALSISGELSDAARILLLDESDWSIIANEEKSAGSYFVATTSGPKTIIARKSDGESQGYGDITPS